MLWDTYEAQIEKSLFSYSIMTPLQMQVAAARICPKCHKRKLVERCTNDFGVWMQCEKCLTVWVLPIINAAQASGEVKP